MLLAALAQVVVATVIVGALVLVPARTLAYPGAWAFLAIFTAGGVGVTVWMARYSPSLLRERMSSPMQREQKAWDKVFLTVLIAGFGAWLALMGWDAARSAFAAVPPWLQAAGAFGVAFYMLGAWVTFRENAFAAAVVKVQESHRVIDTGPYSVVRHPMYASALFFFAGIALLLGSWLGLALAILFMLGIAWRAVREEGVLMAELPGYADYAKRVRYRFVPFVW
jgi:protein-S-isoprenylcysteine O-methyltransferase Ste14